MKAADYGTHTNTVAAFVSTNSICQGQMVSMLWPIIYEAGHEIAFAYSSFKWANLASHNAGVTVIIVGISNHAGRIRRLFSVSDDGSAIVKEVDNINAYLVPAANIIVEKASKPLNGLDEMFFGNKPVDDGALLLSKRDLENLQLPKEAERLFIHRIFGSEEFINGLERYCIWVSEHDLELAVTFPQLLKRFDRVRSSRLVSTKAATIDAARYPHRFAEVRQTGEEQVIVVPSVSSENRNYLPVGILEAGTIISNRNYGLLGASIWNVAIIASRLHWVWIGTVCGRLRTDFSYTNTIGWNTFPVPMLTEQNKADLTRCAENILLAREAHFPATIADLYDPDNMPENLRHAHEQNDEVLERIYIGRRFRNDTERLEKLFEMYTKMTAAQAPPKKTTRKTAQ
jgi:hypothetical protein